MPTAVLLWDRHPAQLQIESRGLLRHTSGQKDVIAVSFVRLLECSNANKHVVDIKEAERLSTLPAPPFEPSGIDLITLSDEAADRRDLGVCPAPCLPYLSLHPSHSPVSAQRSPSPAADERSEEGTQQRSCWAVGCKALLGFTGEILAPRGVGFLQLPSRCPMCPPVVVIYSHVGERGVQEALLVIGQQYFDLVANLNLCWEPSTHWISVVRRNDGVPDLPEDAPPKRGLPDTNSAYGDNARTKVGRFQV